MMARGCGVRELLVTCAIAAFLTQPAGARSPRGPAGRVAEKNLVRDPQRKGMVRESQRRGQRHALIIGVARYQDRSLDLAYADKDARDVHALLTDGATGGRFASSNVTMLINGEATAQRIRHALLEVLPARAASPGDFACIYFSGHGGLRRGAGASRGPDSAFLVPHDGSVDGTNVVPLSLLRDAISQIRAETVLCILDSCNSGFDGGGTLKGRLKGASGQFDAGASPQGFHDSLKMLGNGSGRLIFSSSRSREPSRESSELEQGLFTAAVLEGLRGKADRYEPRNVVTQDELWAYVSSRVRDQTPVRFGVEAGQVHLSFPRGAPPEQQPGGLVLRTASGETAFRVGDFLSLVFQVGSSDSALVLDVTAAGEVNTLFPNEYQGSGPLVAGSPYRIPPDAEGSSTKRYLRVDGPPGRETFVLVSGPDVSQFGDLRGLRSGSGAEALDRLRRRLQGSRATWTELTIEVRR